MIMLNARDVGLLKLKDFCPRCFWFKIKYPIKDKHTFRSPMPGIVSTFDSYTKQVIHGHFKQNNTLPGWAQDALIGTILGDSDSIKNILPSKKWKVKIEEYELTGKPDALFQLQDGSLLIADYKTASLTPAQDEIFPLYEAQLNAYKYLVEYEKFEVKALALIYLEPVRYVNNPDYSITISAEKLTLHFHCVAKPVKIWENRDVEELVREAGKILTLTSPPEGKPGCEHCKGLNDWLNNLMSFNY